mgnify:FL=1
MEKILIGSTIPVLTSKTLADLTIGQIGMLLYNQDESKAPIVVGSEVTNAQLVAARGVQFVRRDTADSFDSSVVIPNKTRRNINYQAYVAGVAGVFKLGDNGAAGTSLTFTDNGEGNIRFADLTNTYQDQFFPANISLTKKSTETVLQYLNRLVTKINSDPVAKTLVTASIETATTNYQMKLVSASSDIKLGIATDGILAPFQPINVTARRLAKGTGAQMSKIEQDLTVFKGNGNYIDNGDLYYKEPLKANVGENYNTLSLSWTGMAQPTVSTSMFVANANILICMPAADTTLAALYAVFTTP